MDKTIIRNFLLALFTGFIASLGCMQAHADEYWDQRVSLFSLLPISNTDIVFLGNSITDGGEFHELFKQDNIKNRGIRSDVIRGVQKRLKQVTGGHPKKIFLLIGINDVAQGLTVDQLAARYEELVKQIRLESPETELYLQSVMPVNNNFKRYKSLIGKERIIREFNNRIKEIASRQGAVYVDLWPYLSDANKNLRREFTNDGLHLNGKGYKAWTNGIRPLVTEK